MNRYYLSFGQVHTHSVRGITYDKDCICIIESESYENARKIAFDTFGDKWCFLYEETPDMSFFPRGLIILKNKIKKNQ